VNRILGNINNVKVTGTGKRDDDSLDKIQLQLSTLPLRE
jgi:hypothetical protein